MPVVSSIFWIAGFAFGVIMGPTLSLWTWGPAMLCFAAATTCAIPNIWRDGFGKFNLYILLSGLATAGWLAVRSWFSPVQELALIDLSLVAMAVSTFIVFQNSFRNNNAQIIIVSGISLLLLANIGIMIAELKNPDYRFLIPYDTRIWPAGFFIHYSHCAAFLISSSLLIAGFAIRSNWHACFRIGILILAVIGLAAVYFTKSRSGFIGAGLGLLTLVIYWIFTAKRDDKKWSGLALILAPIILMVLLAIFLPLLTKVQQTRAVDSDLIDMMDNNIRLILYGISLSCIALHPLLGGGSRSFSWECYRFWDIESMGVHNADPGHIHNELLQVVTDYGIIGGIILLSFIVGVWISCSFKSLVKKNSGEQPNADAWRIGGIAAFMALFAQSNFEGILRMAPGAILLGVCLAAACNEATTRLPSTEKPSWFHRITLTLTAIFVICFLGFYGLKATNVSLDLWKGAMTNTSASNDEKIAAYTRGIGKWQLESLHSARGTLYLRAALQNADEKKFIRSMESALEDYKSAISLNPHSPLYPRNAANALSKLNRPDEAGYYFEKAAQLQGGMEAVFSTHFQYARHLSPIALAQLQNGNFAASIKNYSLAKKHVDQAIGYLHGPAFQELQNLIYINLAIALQNHGEYEKALEQYRALDLLRGANSSNHYVALMYYNRARAMLGENRHSDALPLFIESENLLKTHSPLPQNISKIVRDNLIQAIQKQIQELQAANHTPSEKIILK